MQHTVIRFRIRSLFALTFGVALLMFFVSPYIRILDADRQQKLLITVLLLLFAMVMSTIYFFWKRTRIGQRCGNSLLTLPMESKRKTMWSPWAWVFIHVPLFVWLSFIVYSELLTSSTSSLFYKSLAALLIFLYGAQFAKQLLQYWTEGFPNAIELCEHGIILFSTQFYPWSSSALRTIDWTRDPERISFEAGWSFVTLKVSPEKREEAIEILEKHYGQSGANEK